PKQEKRSMPNLSDSALLYCLKVEDDRLIDKSSQSLQVKDFTSINDISASQITKGSRCTAADHVLTIHGRIDSNTALQLATFPSAKTAHSIGGWIRQSAFVAPLHADYVDLLAVTLPDYETVWFTTTTSGALQVRQNNVAKLL